ncbi:RNA-dependent RNA polymerase 1 [Citrus sinensis]|uniref:RNA-dependent RNA polymerase 1 n=1 Tax=Citrus sinensis TaxID=2711 RepID=A0ACB8M0W6_CITSI|nr:RNA-dependent RNA polymerase 1 [Citrus sinensis]
MAKMIMLYGFGSLASPKAVEEFLEGHTGEGTVSNVEVGQNKCSIAHAIVEFKTVEAAELIKCLARERLCYGNSYLKASDAKRRTPHYKLGEDLKLNFGCQISTDKFSVFWSQENVSVKLCSDLRKFGFFLSYESVDYKLELSYESIWQIELHRPSGHSVKYLVIQNQDGKHALEMPFHLRECCYDPVSWLREQYRKHVSSGQLPISPAVALDDGLIYVNKILVTPSKVYFCGPEISLSNRVISSTNGERRTRIYERVLSTLRNGIVIGDKKFETPAFSNSQERENSLWMFASRPELTAADVRERMRDFREIKNVTKYTSRLGQPFASSRDALHVDSSDIEIIPDVEPDAGPFLSMMLQTFQASNLLDLRTRARIFIYNGLAIMGCLDETGTLEYGQDHDLIPPLQFQPTAYTPAPEKILARDVTIEDVEEYFADYIVNDSLGIICNAHVVYAYSEPDKAMSNRCPDLVKLSSIIGDFQNWSSSHNTQSTTRQDICRLYGEARQNLFYDTDMEVNGFKEVAMQFDGFKYRTEYDNKLGNLMDYYGIKTEAEMLSRCIMEMAKSFDKKRDLEAISFSVRSLRKEARAWFNKKKNDSDSSHKDLLYLLVIVAVATAVVAVVVK